MIRDDPRHATKHKAAESAIPDIVIVNDGSNPPSRDILREFFEIEFPPHEWSPGQECQCAIAGDLLENQQQTPCPVRIEKLC